MNSIQYFVFFIALLSSVREIFAFDSYCAFCDQNVLEAQTFYEDDIVLALYTHKPVLPPHFLVIPKRHVERFEDLSPEEIAKMGETIKKVHSAASRVFGTSSYLLLQKNGEEAGQTVPHVHFHYIARKEGDVSHLKFLYKMYTAYLWPPLSREAMGVVIDQMKKAIEEYSRLNAD